MANAPDQPQQIRADPDNKEEKDPQNNNAQNNNIENKNNEDANEQKNPNPEFKIFIKGLDHSNIEIHARQTDTVLTVKQRYQQATNKPVDRQRLIFAGKELNNAIKLHEYAIRGDSTLHVALRQPANNNQNNQNNNINYQNNNGVFGGFFNQNQNNNPIIINNERVQLLPDSNNINNINRMNNIPIEIQPISIGGILIDPGLFSMFTAYICICCIVPFISLPDVVTLIIVNDYNFNYSKDNITRECIYSMDGYVNISLFLNIGSAISVLIYLVFALWLFWYLKFRNFIQAHRVRPEEVNLSGCHGVMASTRLMNLIWLIVNIGIFGVGCYGIGMYENMLSEECMGAEIGIMLIAWSIIHLLFSFCICFPLCCSFLFFSARQQQN